MPDARLIRKYPNRRLYDTRDSRYVTLADIRHLVLEGEEITVVERSSGSDITPAILLQVIAEQEQQTPTLKDGTLTALIRNLAGPHAARLGPYINECLRQFQRTSSVNTDKEQIMHLADRFITRLPEHPRND